jgi:predicted Zn-ribbon and HTH transcriptional regulator
MTSVWSGIDPNVAEQRLRATGRRLIELDEALASQRALIQTKPNSFAFSLGYESLVQIQQRLLTERSNLLAHRVAERLDAAIDGASFLKDGASVGTLGTLLIRLQKLYSSIAQAVTQGPTLRGPLSNQIISATELRLASTFPSSFGMSLIVQRAQCDLLPSYVPSAALERLFSLLSTDQTPEAIMQVTGELGGRVLNHYLHVANILRRTDSSLKLEWSDSEGIKHYFLTSAKQASELVTLLNEIKAVESVTLKISGRIVGASLLRSRFEMTTEDGQVIEGKVSESALRDIGASFGKNVTVEVDKTTVNDHRSGDAKTYYALVGIDQVEDSTSQSS